MTTSKNNIETKNKRLNTAVLKYPKNAPAPFLIAKGKGELAEKILKLAKENSIPIVENISETEVITLLEIGECIPEQTYEIIAKVFAFLNKI
ncbi:MAG: EscU/YscU/HrcU family type III secretion system export apparatus switch protein [Treponemataceae bacterium]